MLELNKNPLVKGYTTNPALMRKAGVVNYEEFAKKVVANIPDKPISFEVIGDSDDEMYRQAKIISSWGSNVFVKIPVVNSEGKPSYDLIKKLVSEGIKINVTAILTLEQITQTIEALGNNESIISIFSGRINDCSKDAMWFVKYAVSIKQPKQKILWASVRELYNLVQAQIACADIVTVPNNILEKLPTLDKSLEEMSLDTVRMFLKDATESGYKL
jgi:transaldolase